MKTYKVRSPLKYDKPEPYQVGETVQMTEEEAKVLIDFHILEELPAKEQALVPTLEEFVAAGYKAESYENTESSGAGEVESQGTGGEVPAGAEQTQPPASSEKE